MDPKTELTKYVAEQLGIATDDKNIRKLKQYWWKNPRIKSTGGFKLTELGYEALKKADIQDYRIRIEKPIILNNQYIIWLDRFIDCPWHLTNKEIFVFGEKMAVQLVLFSGNVLKFAGAKAKITLTNI